MRFKANVYIRPDDLSRHFSTATGNGCVFIHRKLQLQRVLTDFIYYYLPTANSFFFYLIHLALQ